MKYSLFLRRAASSLGAALLVATLSGTDVPQNLGNGLDKLLESNIALNKAQAAKAGILTFNGFASEQAASFDSIAIKHPSSERYLVDIHPSGRVPFEQLKNELSARFSSLQITATDSNYRGVGVIEGYISVDEVAALANLRGVVSVQLSLKPYHKRAPAPNIGPGTSALTVVGTTFDQGVTQHRVDKINTIYNPSAPMTLDGTGMSIGALSDSFDTGTQAPHASTAVAAFDLPGSPMNPYNTTPVTVLQDESPGSGSDEGRGMCEIIYKMAPRAKIGFATADFGEVGFANNIRALAGLNGFTYPNQTFKADTICDDVGYFDEPWYQDGIIGAAIDDVAAAGVSYFSSAANDIGTNGYSSILRWVPNGTGLTAAAGNTALAGTNVNLANVPPALYAGGFHNFNPNPGQRDVAQTWALPLGGQFFVVQWDDPYDQNTMATLDQPAIYQNNGTINASPFTVTFTDIPALNSGDLYELDVSATSGNLDVIVTVRDPNNNVIVSQDNGIDEVVRFFAPVSGSGYSVTIGRFSGTTGSFHLDMYHSVGFTGTTITTDINVLTFRIDTGAYIGSSALTANNLATNQPIELGTVTRPNGQAGVQFVIARSNVPSAAVRGPTHVRMLDAGNGAGGIGAVEYFTYDTVTTGGHATAKGCNGTAAYSVFRPSRPETFTSPGPAIYYFDKMSNRLAVPEIRLQPRIAAADGGNTSFFTTDWIDDGDGNPNFFGTSAAGPHAAAIAALVLQAHGGPGMVTPAQMTSILQRSTFIHDLDPMFASGSATAGNGGTVKISVNSDSSSVGVPAGTSPAITTGGLGLQDVNSWKVAYSGPGFLTSLTFNPQGNGATGGSPTSGNNGVDSTNTYFSNVYPGVVFKPATKAFTLGTLTGLTTGDITPPQSTTPFTGFSHLAPLPSNGTSHFWTMAIGFPTSNFTDGRSMQFTIGRGEQHSANVGTFGVPAGGAPFAGPNSGSTTTDATADLLGGAVLIPEGTLTATGMTFSGTVSDGANSFPFNGTINNRLGTGYTVQDGYGFINAEAAVSAPLQGPAPVQLNSVASRKNHVGQANFDIPLPLVGNPGIECRNGGANGNFTMVFKFQNTIASIGGAIVTGGIGSVSSTIIQGSEYVVNLTGVANAQKISVALIDITDASGNNSPSFSGSMGVLLADVNATTVVDSGDVFLVRQQTGQTTNSTNFRKDINASGLIDSGDVFLTRQKTGSFLP